MICVICIILFLAFVPVGYYFFGPMVLVIASVILLFIEYRHLCKEKICGGKNGK